MSYVLCPVSCVLRVGVSSSTLVSVSSRSRQGIIYIGHGYVCELTRVWSRRYEERWGDGLFLLSRVSLFGGINDKALCLFSTFSKLLKVPGTYCSRECGRSCRFLPTERPAVAASRLELFGKVPAALPYFLTLTTAAVVVGGGDYDGIGVSAGVVGVGIDDDGGVAAVVLYVWCCMCRALFFCLL